LIMNKPLAFEQRFALQEHGDLLLTYLKQLGVEYVFGLPGGAIEPLYNALARSERYGGPKAMVARHESGAAFMADGYARNTGKLGVCCATTGPGATNLITGVASAYENNVPLLVITAQTSLSSFGSGAFQESSCTGINTVALFQHCSKYSTLVSHAAQFERKLTTAIITAFAEPHGPVHLSIPVDVMREQHHSGRPEFNLPALLRKPSLFDSDAVKELSKEIKKCHNPVFIIGDEAREAVGLILTLAMKIGAQLVVTPHGKGLVSPYHPLFRGVIGFSGHQDARQLMSDPTVDKVFVIGANLGEWASSGWDPVAQDQLVIHVEESDSNLTKTPMASLHVRGRLKTIFETLLAQLGDVSQSSEDTAVTDETAVKGNKKSFKRSFQLDDEEKYVSDEIPIKPQRLMRELPRIFPAHTHYLADVGNSFSWATHYLHPYDRRVYGQRDARGGLFRATLDFAAMGWAIGSAIGTALARPGEPVVCITGDGSMLMNGQEITVAIEQKLPVVFVVLNDSAYGMVKHGQKLTGAEQIGTDLPKTDFAAFAGAMGVPSQIIYSADDLLALDGQQICRRPGPTLLDVRIDPTETPPIGIRTEAIKQF
jgi:acetolactate synthase-1/2/3 large subunit